MSTPDTPPIRCRGLCDASVVDDEAALRAGWSYLQITAGWRCGPCGRALLAAAHFVGTDQPAAVDTLPPNSRGALPKETASTVLPPSVRA